MNKIRLILLIDAMNLFVRCFSAFPSMDINGNQMGGVVGSIKMTRKIVEQLQPSAVYFAWEGGGSQRRRALFKEYKMNRRPFRLNRYYEDDIPESDDNRKHQIMVLLELLKCLPVCQLYTPDCEGDDVIAHLCTNTFQNSEKIIASSDKDLWQLLNDKTRVYSLHKKTYVTQENVFEEFRVTSKNFAIAKALCGDASDNIPGVKGMGFKTLCKHFPFLGTEKEALLEEVISYAHSHKDEAKIFQRVIDQQDDIKRNWRLVYLDGGMLSHQQVTKIDRCVDTFEPRADKMGFMKLLMKHEFGQDIDVHSLIQTFNCIDGIAYGSKQ